MSTHSSPKKLQAGSGRALEGRVRVPGDKSISHRALMFSALAVGESEVAGLLTGEDVLATGAAMRALGADIRISGTNATIQGVGVGGLREPDTVLDMGNSGTSARLLTGLLSTHPIFAVMTGDASLRKRPMARVTEPLAQMGGRFWSRDGSRLPLAIKGALDPLPLEYRTPVASAQVKSSLLLAALNTAGTSLITESIHTRDHSERMLRAMGAALETRQVDDGFEIALTGEADLSPAGFTVPGDISSAAFLMVAASLLPGSDIIIESVGVNPLRDGSITALQTMGADITLSNRRTIGGEPVADIAVRAAELTGVTDLAVEPSIMIDEFPVLFVAAACASGTSRFKGLKELRVKESDRLTVMAAGLKAAGVPVEVFEDGLEIEGRGGTVPGGCSVAAHLDHRIAMSFAVLGQCADHAIIIDDASPIDTSFPGFVDVLAGMGAALRLEGL